MAKKYIYIFIILFGIQWGVVAQNQDKLNSKEIEGLHIYPNPTTNNRVYVVTDSSVTKDVEIFDLLGKKVFSTTINGVQKELNLSQLKPGVYLIQVKEKDITITRKLVLK